MRIEGTRSFLWSLRFRLREVLGNWENETKNSEKKNCLKWIADDLEVGLVQIGQGEGPTRSSELHGSPKSALTLRIDWELQKVRMQR